MVWLAAAAPLAAQAPAAGKVATAAASSPSEAASSPAGVPAGAAVPAAWPVVTVGDARYLLVPASALPTADKKEKDEGAFAQATALISALVPLAAAVAWPLASLWLAWWLLQAPQVQFLLSRVSRRITQLNVAGLEIKLSEGAAATLEDIQKLIRQVPETHKDWVSNSHVGPQFQLVVSDLKHLLTVRGLYHGQPLTDKEFGRFRFTLHVPDVLLAHSFRQLVDYIGDRSGGAGRIFSMRMGIIGKAWRSGRSEFVPHYSFTDEDLIEQWGMTRAEAEGSSRGKNIYLAVLIESAAGLPLAVLYADADQSPLFSNSHVAAVQALHPGLGLKEARREIFHAFETEVLAFFKTRKLLQSLEALEDARIKVPQIDLYDLRNA